MRTSRVEKIFIERTFTQIILDYHQHHIYFFSFLLYLLAHVFFFFFLSKKQFCYACFYYRAIQVMSSTDE